MRFELMPTETAGTVKIGRLHGLAASLHTLRVGAQIELRRRFALQPSVHLQRLGTIATGQGQSASGCVHLESGMSESPGHRAACARAARPLRSERLQCRRIELDAHDIALQAECALQVKPVLPQPELGVYRTQRRVRTPSICRCRTKAGRETCCARVDTRP